MGWVLVVLIIISCALTTLKSYVFINIQSDRPPPQFLIRRTWHIKGKKMFYQLQISLIFLINFWILTLI